MDSRELLFIIFFVFAVLVSSVSQILLKISAGKSYDKPVKEYMNPWVIIGYFLFFCSTLITVSAYSVLPLSLGPVLESLGYVFVAVLSYLILKEHTSKKAIVGLAIIIIGVVIASI